MRLAQAHRLAQLRLGARVVVLMHAAFRLLDPKALDATFEDWLVVVEPLVQNGRRMSAQMAAAYLAEARRQSVGFDGTFVPVVAGDVSRDRLRTSLLVTGPLSIKRAMTRGVQLGRAVDVAGATSSAAAMRHALDGGRETILGSIRRDDRANGWRRLTSGKPCKFCSMLAGRGAVYSADTVDFHAHDGCSCSAEPVYS